MADDLEPLMDDNIDQWTMLFSSDWFLPHWQLVGFQTSQQLTMRIQKLCQQLVIEMIGVSESYWLISFAAQRRADTRKQFLKALRTSGASEHVLARFNALLSFGQKQGGKDFDAWAISSVNSCLQDEFQRDLPPLNSLIRERILRTWERHQPRKEGLELAALNSKSGWDTWLRRLTPELPEYLSDFLTNYLRLSFNIQPYWQELMSTVPETERLKLSDWYRQAARQLLSAEIGTPS